MAKILANTGKNGAQHLQKIQSRPFFGGHTKNRSSSSLWEKMCEQKAHKNVLGKFGEIRTKMLLDP